MNMLKNTVASFCDAMVEKASTFDINTRSMGMWGEPEFPTDTDEE